MSRKIAFKTLGCRLNQFETDALASEFHNAGYQIVDFEGKADVYVVNTCTVTKQSDKKSRNIINHAARKPGEGLVVVTGCMVNSQKDALENRDSSTYFVENDRKTSIFPMVEAHYKGEILHPNSLDPDVFDYKPADTTFHTRSLIKIQDGCDNFCTFCIVPFVRGRAVSRPFEKIRENILQVLEFGFKEIVLTGVNIGRYDHEGMNFELLVEKILEIPGDFRVRISSIEPDGYGDRFIELFNNPKLLPHLHICLQSGSDPVLLRMRRMYSLSEFRAIVDKVRSSHPDFNLTTDIIVGFPGETENDFKATCDIVKDIGFSHIHTFKYSKRKGTRAERMPGQIQENLKNERSEIIRLIGEKNKRKYRNSLIGQTQTVLVEKVLDGKARGYGEYYVPIVFPVSSASKNDTITVRVTGISDGDDPDLIGEMLP
ncbi:MAG TPA: tRNA (N(6)-L-threonylcarbamoyladenosine(37)-C(2))-methylthiotransferase MtaB [Bacteroides sp.]|nr:tRNA (N(6)-L-threonylcarbamoyladenosine(37)-C(2))-methylthiotransferase MtaB [Bacteroides sp.]